MSNNNLSLEYYKTPSKYLILRNLAFFCMLGFLVYHWFPFPPIVWRLALLGVCVIGFLIHLSRFKFTAVEKSMLFFVALNVIYYFFSFMWQTPETTNFGNVLCSMLPIPLFFTIAANGAITQKSLTVFLILSCIAGYFYFNHAESLILERLLRGEPGGITINASTVFLVIIPLLFFVRNRWMTIGISVIIIFFIIYGAKRGNIISAALPFYLLARMKMKSNRSLISEVLLIIVVIAISYFAYYTMMNSEYLVSRIEKTFEGDSSYRNIIYATAFDTWLNAEAINVFFGYGTDGTINLIGIRAHNDWLEILVDFGLLGVLVYLIFFICMVRAIHRNKHNLQLFYAFLAVFFIWFSKSLYSMGFTNDIFSFLSAVIGMVLGLEYRQRQGLPIYSKN